MRRVDVAAVRRVLAEEEEAKPDEWTGAYVGERLVHAFRILARMPRVGHQAAFRRAVIEVLQDVFTEEFDLLQIKEPVVSRIRPTGRDIRLMEDALLWPMKYLPHDQIQRHGTMIWAHGVARNFPAGRITAQANRRYALSTKKFHEARMAGCRTIALSLRRDHVPIE